MNHLKSYKVFESNITNELRKDPYFQEIGNTAHDIFTPLYEYGFSINIHPLENSIDNIGFVIVYTNPRTADYSIHNRNFHYEECQDEVEHLDSYMNGEGYWLDSIEYSPRPIAGHRPNKRLSNLRDLSGECISMQLTLVYTK